MFGCLGECFAGLLFRLKCAARNLRGKGRPNIATLDLPSRPAGAKPFVIGRRHGVLPDTRAFVEKRVVGEGLDEATRLLEEALGTKIDAYDGGQGPSAEGVPARGSVAFYPKEEDVASEVRRLRALNGDAPILVLGLRLEPRLARTALLAGADGFVYPGMRPAQIVELLGAASGGETLVPRDLLEAFLAEMVSRADLLLTPRQREFLELIAVSATSKAEIVVPRELLNAFLRGAPAA